MQFECQPRKRPERARSGSGGVPHGDFSVAVVALGLGLPQEGLVEAAPAPGAAGFADPAGQFT